MKTLSKNQRQEKSKQQRKTKLRSLQEKAIDDQPGQQKVAAPEDEQLGFTTQESEIEAFYRKVAADEASRERHAEELMQTPGLEHLTAEEALEQIDFMQRFAAWVFQQHCRELHEAESGRVESNSSTITETHSK